MRKIYIILYVSQGIMISFWLRGFLRIDLNVTTACHNSHLINAGQWGLQRWDPYQTLEWRGHDTLWRAMTPSDFYQTLRHPMVPLILVLQLISIHAENFAHLSFQFPSSNVFQILDSAIWNSVLKHIAVLGICMVQTCNLEIIACYKPILCSSTPLNGVFFLHTSWWSFQIYPLDIILCIRIFTSTIAACWIIPLRNTRFLNFLPFSVKHDCVVFRLMCLSMYPVEVQQGGYKIFDLFRLI